MSVYILCTMYVIGGLLVPGLGGGDNQQLVPTLWAGGEAFLLEEPALRLLKGDL